MTSLLFPTNQKPLSKPREIWEYWRPESSRIVELGTVRGFNVSLPVHFHDEDQLTFVLSGQRRFIIDNELLHVTPGQGVHIPARTPHRSLSESLEVVCINIYTPPGAYAASDVISGLARHWRRTGRISWPDLTIIAEDHRCFAATIVEPVGRVDSSAPWEAPWETVSQMAQRTGMSREGFSRQFRRRHGVPPHAFWLLEKLNDARRLLRAGDPIAAVAAETGFSDQSHLGRCFRRAFGVTPGRYRAG